MSKLLMEYLLLKENEANYTDEEVNIIKDSILKKCNAHIKSFTNTFVEAIDKIND